MWNHCQVTISGVTTFKEGLVNTFVGWGTIFSVTCTFQWHLPTNAAVGRGFVQTAGGRVLFSVETYQSTRVAEYFKDWVQTLEFDCLKGSVCSAQMKWETRKRKGRGAFYNRIFFQLCNQPYYKSESSQTYVARNPTWWQKQRFPVRQKGSRVRWGEITVLYFFHV